MATPAQGGYTGTWGKRLVASIPFDFIQDEDPATGGAIVGAWKTWLQPSTMLFYARNETDTAWNAVAGGGGGTPPEEPPDEEEPPTEPPDTTIINISDTSLIMDGVTDQSSAWQTVLNNAPDGTEFRFPTSPTGPLCIKNVVLNNRHYLTFVGPSKDTISILWNGLDNEGIMTFQAGSTNITFRNMGICNRAVRRFGGMRFFDAHDILFDTCKIFDDQPIVLTSTEDRYSIVFGFGGATAFSTDVEIKDCEIENLQLEIDHSKNVHIHGCTSSYSKSTAALGFWHRSHNSVMEDYLIENNTINSQVRSPLGAITFFHDVAGLNFCSTQRIIVRNNIINHLGGLNINSEPLTVNPGITFGGPTGTAQGNIHKDITVEGNIITLAHGVNLKDPHGAISFYGTSGNSIDFQNITVRDNSIHSIAFTPTTSYGITARRISNSVFDGNVVSNVATGIKLSSSPIANITFTDNLVIDCTTGWTLNNIVGGVSLDTSNEYVNAVTPINLVTTPGGTNTITGPGELTTQALAPDAVTTRDNWTDEADGTTNIFNSINETTADDNDYVQSEETPTDSPLVVRITAGDDPVASYAHSINYRYRKNFDAGETINLIVQLRQGYTNEGSQGTLIASTSYADISGVDWVDGSMSLTAAEADAITNYATLYVRFVADAE